MSRIIVRVFGGLGNQLFIYAAAKALSLRTNSKLEIENRTGFVKDSYKRSYKLQEFILNEKKSSLYNSFFFILRKRFFLTKLFFYKNSNYLKESDASCFQKELTNYSFSGITFMEGYWQSPLYFKGFENEIKKNLQIKKILKNINLKISKDIEKNNSIALHIRRKDYNNKLNLNYYVKAIDLIYKQVKSPKFYIFSDDIKWCKENLKNISNNYFIENNDEITDFYLMTKCKNFIIANSSFSWWGAWLSEHENKLVIAPLNPGIGCDEFYPDNWILI